MERDGAIGLLVLVLAALLWAYRAIWPRVTQEDALRIAREECERRGWPWVEPIGVSRHLLGYEILTNMRSLGQNATIRVSGRSGIVVQASFLP